MDAQGEALVTGMLEAFNQRRFDDFADAYARDAQLTYPQSGERIIGRNNIRGMVEAFPSPPRFTVRDVRSADDLVVVEADADYGHGDSWKAALIYTVRSDHVVAETAYFAGPFEAAEWRAPFREP